ncbi:unnamed protein product, partial [Nesidiocoris tenuis]
MAAHWRAGGTEVRYSSGRGTQARDKREGHRQGRRPRGTNCCRDCSPGSRAEYVYGADLGIIIPIRSELSLHNGDGAMKLELVFSKGTGADVKESEMSSLAGVAVKLPCVMGPTLCGNVHSMRWYKNDERVFVFSSRAKISRAENSLASRPNTRWWHMSNTTYDIKTASFT